MCAAVFRVCKIFRYLIQVRFYIIKYRVRCLEFCVFFSSLILHDVWSSRDHRSLYNIRYYSSRSIRALPHVFQQYFALHYPANTRTRTTRVQRYDSATNEHIRHGRGGLKNVLFSFTHRTRYSCGAGRHLF